MFSTQRSGLLRQRTGNPRRRRSFGVTSLGVSTRLILCALLCATNANAQPSEQLHAEIPEGWIQSHANTLATMSVSEWVPPDTQGSWQQKVIIEAMEGSGLPDPIEFVEGLADSQREACEKLVDNPVYSGFENGYPTAVHILECHANKTTKKPLLTMVKAVKGNKAFYTITRIWRLEPVPGTGLDAPLPIEPEEVGAWAAQLNLFKLCDSTLEAHPCDAN